MPIRRTASVAALIGFEVGALVTLHHLGSYDAAAIGWDDLSIWLAQTPPEDAIVAIVRLTALALAWWLTASTVLYAVARATRIPGLVRRVRWATVAPIRRMIDGALATSVLVGSTLVAPGVAVAAPVDRPAVVVQLDERPEQADESSRPAYQPRPAGDKVKPGYEPAPAGDLPPTPSTSGADSSSSSNEPAPRSDDPPAEPSPGTYVVRRGDNLWTIAEQHLATATGRPVHELDTGEIRSYWQRVMNTNQGRVRSRNSDLIQPGEQLVLPEAILRPNTKLTPGEVREYE